MNRSIEPPRGILLGAALMYLLDPDRGHRRRAVIADKARKLRRRSSRALRVAAHDLENRARGTLARLGVGLEHESVDDRRLEARIRARLGRVCSHPHAIEIHVEDGVATVTGPVLLDEWRRVRRTIKETRDLREVDDRLEIHSVADIPRLMGGRPRVRTIREALEGNWTPATRLVVGSVGVTTAVASLALDGWRRRIALGAGLALLGNAAAREARVRQGSSTPFGLGEAAALGYGELGYDELEAVTGESEYISEP